MKIAVILTFIILSEYPIYGQFVKQDKNYSYFTSNVRHENYLNFNSNMLLNKNRDTKLLIPAIYSLSIQAINISLLVVTKKSDHPPSWLVFKEAFTKPPVFDDDFWLTNYVAHPLMGSETYLRARDSDVNILGSFLFSTSSSLVWEYFIESWTERPSIQDMLVTSTIGSVLGELRFSGKKKINQKYKWIVDPLWTVTCLIIGSSTN